MDAIAEQLAKADYMKEFRQAVKLGLKPPRWKKWDTPRFASAAEDGQEIEYFVTWLATWKYMRNGAQHFCPLSAVDACNRKRPAFGSCGGRALLDSDKHLHWASMWTSVLRESNRTVHDLIVHENKAYARHPGTGELLLDFANLPSPVSEGDEDVLSYGEGEAFTELDFAALPAEMRRTVPFQQERHVAFHDEGEALTAHLGGAMSGEASDLLCQRHFDEKLKRCGAAGNAASRTYHCLWRYHHGEPACLYGSAPYPAAPKKPSRSKTQSLKHPVAQKHAHLSL